jgi:hypothetical protein
MREMFLIATTTFEIVFSVYLGKVGPGDVGEDGSNLFL